MCGVAIKIKEYTEFKKDEIWQLYTQVGWTAYTENMTALERYADVRQIQLVTDNTPKTVAFYQSLGFVEREKLGCCGFMRARQLGFRGDKCMEKKSRRSGTDPVVALTLIFVVLKVMGLISWSWLWVLSPIWLTFLFFAAIFSVILVGGRIAKGKW